MRHADAIVLDGEALGILVDGNPNRERIRCERRIFQRLIAQFLASIGGVGKKFAQKNVAIGIDRMHHEMQQFGDIRLKCLRLRSLTVIPLPPASSAPPSVVPTASRIWRCCRWSSCAPPPVRGTDIAVCARRMQGLQSEFFAFQTSQSQKIRPICLRACRKSVKRMLALPQLQATMVLRIKKSSLS